MSDHPLRAVWERCKRLDRWLNEGVRPKAQPREDDK